MRIASLAIALATAAIVVGIVAHSPDRAAADYNITGEWTISFDDGPPCPATIVQTPAQNGPDSLSIALSCFFPKLYGIIDAQTGDFHVYFNTEFDLEGNVSADKQTMSGTYYQQLIPGEPRTYGSFTGRIPPVGGVALDATTSHGESSRPQWLITLASVSIASLGGAALYGRRLLAASKTDR